MAFLLAVDGGGTGCRAVLADRQGTVLARGEGGPANIASDPRQAAQNLRDLARAVLAQVVGAAEVEHELSRLHAVMGLAGANVAQAVAGLRAALPMAALRIEGDALIALKGALQDQDGIVAAIGTGSVFIRQRAGQVHRIGGRGFVLGDEGSGAWLGRALLARALRACDGLVPHTSLLQSVLADLGGAEAVIRFGFAASPADFARLAPRVLASDDPAALALMAVVEADIGGSIAALQTDPPLPVVFLGGIGEALAPRFAAMWPSAPALGTGLDGALWLALREGAGA